MSRTFWLLISLAVLALVFYLFFKPHNTSTDKMREEFREAREETKEAAEATGDYIKDTGSEIKQDLQEVGDKNKEV